jgi:iron complex transport system substrate-binding protein
MPEFPVTASVPARPVLARRSRTQRAPRALLSLVAALAIAACSASSPTPTPVPITPAPATSTATSSPTASPTPVPPFPASLTDDEGTTVAIPAEPARIVSLTPAVTETLFALGVGDRIVGKAQDILLYPPEAAAVPDVEKFDGNAIVVDTEKILAAHPDLVVAGGNFGTPPDAVQKLRSLGLRVMVVYAASVNAVFTDIELLGRAVGRATEASAMTTRMRAAFSAVAAAVAGSPRPRVYYELDAATGVFYGPADHSFLAEMIGLAGGDPITTGSADKYDIAAERLLKANPEVILLADAAFGVKAEDVAKRPGWSTMTAVKDGDIRPIEDATITRPGPRLILGLYLLASTIHPDVAIASPPAIPPIP